MRAIGHFLIFVGFFLALAFVLALVLLGAAAFKTWLPLLAMLPLGYAMYRLYAWSYRMVRVQR